MKAIFWIALLLPIVFCSAVRLASQDCKDEMPGSYTRLNPIQVYNNDVKYRKALEVAKSSLFKNKVILKDGITVQKAYVQKVAGVNYKFLLKAKKYSPPHKDVYVQAIVHCNLTGKCSLVKHRFV